MSEPWLDPILLGALALLLGVTLGCVLATVLAGKERRR